MDRQTDIQTIIEQVNGRGELDALPNEAMAKLYTPRRVSSPGRDGPTQEYCLSPGYFQV